MLIYKKQNAKGSAIFSHFSILLEEQRNMKYLEEQYKEKQKYSDSNSRTSISDLLEPVLSPPTPPPHKKLLLILNKYNFSFIYSNVQLSIYSNVQLSGPKTCLPTGLNKRGSTVCYSS